MCRLDPWDTDVNSFYLEQERRARKTHRCRECYREIGVGEVYLIASGKSDGSVWASKMCAHCRVASEWLVRNCNGFIFGAVIEDVHEHAEGDLPLLKLVVGARRGWRSFVDPDRLLPVPLDPPDMGPEA